MGNSLHMYDNESRVDQIEQPIQNKWFKILLTIGSIILGFSFLLMASYWTFMLVVYFVEEASSIATPFIAINTVSTYFMLIGMIVLVIGYFGLAFSTKGVGKITLLIGAITFLLIILIDIGMIIVNSIVIPILIENSGTPACTSTMLATITFVYLMVKFVIITIAFFVVSFTKGELKNSNTEYKIFTISAFILPLWIVVMLVGFILGFVLKNSNLYFVIFMSGIIAFCLNQVAYAIEFLVKVAKI